jgi:hypothetical protein
MRQDKAGQRLKQSRCACATRKGANGTLANRHDRHWDQCAHIETAQVTLHIAVPADTSLRFDAANSSMIVAPSYERCMFFAATCGVGHGYQTGPTTEMLCAASGKKWHRLVGRGEPPGLKGRGSPDSTAYGSHQAVVALPGKPTQADTS